MCEWEDVVQKSRLTYARQTTLLVQDDTFELDLAIQFVTFIFQISQTSKQTLAKLLLCTYSLFEPFDGFILGHSVRETNSTILCLFPSNA